MVLWRIKGILDLFRRPCHLWLVVNMDIENRERESL